VTWPQVVDDAVGALRVVGYIVAERHSDGSMSIDYQGPVCHTIDDAKQWATEPNDVVVAVCEVAT
jgi:hypothetical protein